MLPDCQRLLQQSQPGYQEWVAEAEGMLEREKLRQKTQDRFARSVDHAKVTPNLFLSQHIY